MSIHIPPEWEKSLQEITQKKGVTVLLGPTDSGKTTLAKYLVEKEVEKGEEVAFIDGDIGQSTLGPPTTISLATFKSYPLSWDQATPLSMRFIGSTSPSGHLLETVSGIKAMLDKAISLGLNKVIVDTTGMIAGEEALALKVNKVNLLSPTYILALQQEEELEGILQVLEIQKRFLIHRLKPSPQVGKKNQPERKRFRVRKFQEYFQGANSREFNNKEIALYRLSPLKFKNQLLGLLNRNFETLSLGIGREWTRNSLKIITPLANLEEVKIIQGSSLKIDPESGEEIGP